jgi:hypothetical protein
MDRMTICDYREKYAADISEATKIVAKFGRKLVIIKKDYDS